MGIALESAEEGDDEENAAACSIVTRRELNIHLAKVRDYFLAKACDTTSILNKLMDIELQANVVVPLKQATILDYLN